MAELMSKDGFMERKGRTGFRPVDFERACGGYVDQNQFSRWFRGGMTKAAVGFCWLLLERMNGSEVDVVRSSGKVVLAAPFSSGQVVVGDEEIRKVLEGAPHGFFDGDEKLEETDPSGEMDSDPFMPEEFKKVVKVMSWSNDVMGEFDMQFRDEGKYRYFGYNEVVCRCLRSNLDSCTHLDFGGEEVLFSKFNKKV